MSFNNLNNRQNQLIYSEKWNSIISRGNFDEFLSALEEQFPNVYDQSIGVHEGYSLKEHTQMVARQFAKYFVHSELPGNIDKNIFLLIIALHDIGKPAAISNGGKYLQHIHTKEIIQNFFQDIGLEKKYINLALALVESDPLGNYLTGSSREEALQKIEHMASTAGMPVKDFFEILCIYYKIDAGSYTKDAGGIASLDYLFVFDNAKNRLDFSFDVQKKIDLLGLNSSKDSSLKISDELSFNSTIEDLNNIPFENRVSFMLNNPDTISFINEFPENFRNDIIGDLIQYLIIFKDGMYFKDYINSLKSIISLEKHDFEKEKIKLLIGFIIKKLGIEKLDLSEKNEKIYTYFLENYIKKGYFFHSFNGSFEKSIRENGLDVNLRFWDWEELKEIISIGERVGEPMILGWINLNCEGKISIADSTDNIFRYGYASPEWFAQFTSEGFHIPAISPYDKKAFYRKDYHGAKKNILMLCEKLMSRSEEDIQAKRSYPNITLEEKLKILKFFEKYWDFFVVQGNGSKCALIKKSAINEDKGFETYKEFCDVVGAASIEECVGITAGGHHHDVQLNNNISAKDIKIIDLPEYNKIYP